MLLCFRRVELLAWVKKIQCLVKDLLGNMKSGHYLQFQNSVQVLSKGVLRKEGSVQIGHTATLSLILSPDMMPSFRLVGYYYDNNEIIADSIWVDVKDQCEGNVSKISLCVFNSFSS